MKITVILNAKAGTDQKAPDVARIAAAFAAHGATAEIRPTPPGNLSEATKKALGEDADVIAMAGGDGTMNAGARVLAGTDRCMGVLPLGTLNHFAKDLGIPGAVEEAAATLLTGVPRAVDVGDANGHVFLNNSSIGLYPAAVLDRDSRQREQGMGKWTAMTRAVLSTLHSFPEVTVTLRMLEESVRLTTPLVFVGNNRYEMTFWKLGTRARLDEGELWLYVATNTGRFGMAKLAVRALCGRLLESRDFQAMSLPELTVDSRRRALSVALDGEVLRLTPPVRYVIRPGALRVMVPAPPPAAEEAADPSPETA